MEITKQARIEMESKKLAMKIRNVKSELPDIHSLQSPLHKSLWALAAAKEAGEDRPLTSQRMRILLEVFDVAITDSQITNALSRSGDKIIRKNRDGVRGYKIAFTGKTALMNTAGGEGIEVIYAEPGNRWKARRQLSELAGSLKGDLLAVDKYYGERTLYTLETLANRKENVRFITSHTRENAQKLSALFGDLMNAKPNLEVRLYSGKHDLHDRYILSDDALVLVGHGLKDLGASESFVVRLDTRVVGELMSLVRCSFEDRWSKSTPI